MKKILNREFYKLTPDERSDFAYFILSLLARHPDAVALVKAKGLEAIISALARDPDEYEAVKGSPSGSAPLHATDQLGKGGQSCVGSLRRRPCLWDRKTSLAMKNSWRAMLATERLGSERNRTGRATRPEAGSRNNGNSRGEPYTLNSFGDV
jgi:hypothetical protein